MSTTLRFGFSISVEEDGHVVTFLPPKMRESTLTGEYADGPIEFTVAAGATQVLWAWSSTKPSFEMLAIDADGELLVRVKSDKPGTDAALTAQGTHINYAALKVTAVAPLVLSSDNNVVDTNATAKSTDPLSSGVAGKVYEVAVKNAGTEAVKVRIWAAN